MSASDTLSTQAQDLFELANLYPSPHNGQPIRLRLKDERSIELYFERQRGLQASDISFIFSFVSMGVFVRHLELCVQALGHRLDLKLELPAEEDLRGEGTVAFATGGIEWDAAAADPKIAETLRFRQTSRKKYYSGINEELSENLIATAAGAGMALHRLAKRQSQQAVWLNQRAIFDDMFDEPVRQELDHWLRYDQTEKLAKRDGLAYDCMELSGSLMKRIVAHPGVLRAPGLSVILKEYYLRTMKDDSDVLYMLAPFATEQQAYDVGLMIMKLWYELSAKGYYLHPFGTIMSNHDAHRDFLQLAGINNETRESSYLVFIFRAGKSQTPVASMRLPYEDHLLIKE